MDNLCSECCIKSFSHKIATGDLCCGCHIEEGYPPADWHPERMSTYGEIIKIFRGIMKNWWRWRWLRPVRFFWYKHIKRLDIIGFFMGVPIIRSKYLRIEKEDDT